MIIHMGSKHLFLIITQNLQKVNKFFTTFFIGKCNEKCRNLKIWLYFEVRVNCVRLGKSKNRRIAQVSAADFVCFV